MNLYTYTIKNKSCPWLKDIFHSFAENSDSALQLAHREGVWYCGKDNFEVTTPTIKEIL